MDITDTFRRLDLELKSVGLQREFFICGGAALIVLGVISRETKDIDVVSPKLDEEFKALATKVGERFGLHEGWINNGPDDLLRNLEPGWKSRSTLIYNGEALRIYSLSRQDMLNTKLWAACDRIEDIQDIIQMKPTEAELNKAKEWTLRCDASEIWPKIVEQCLAHIKEKLGYG